jgi:glycerate 2-kinase
MAAASEVPTFATFAMPGAPRGAVAAQLEQIYLDVAAACDGQRLVAAALGADDDPGAAAWLGQSSGRALQVLALGKAAAPMLAGLRQAWAADPDRGPLAAGLVIAPGPRAPAPDTLPPGFDMIAGEHPDPGTGSLRAGAAARALVERLGPGDPLLVLLSGGGSALACLPASGLGLADKRAAIAAVAAAGAPIDQVNSLRKHLSAIKGGRLGQLARGPVLVLALSDVVGDDPGTIASGPFSPDATTYADALAVLQTRTPPGAAPALTPVIRHLHEGIEGRRAETPKPGPGWDHIRYRVLAGPAHVVDAAVRSTEVRGAHPVILVRNTQATVAALAETYVAHAHQLAARAAAAPDVMTVGVGNGEPTIDLSAGPGGDSAARSSLGRGGRATHLALLVARGLARIAGSTPATLAFLAAGTDDRDGSGDASGAVVDDTTWPRALAAGLDPEGALTRFDSAGLLGRLGCLVRGPGTSNLLDVHLLAAARRPK